MLSNPGKIITYLNYKIRLVTKESRAFVGTFKAFDKHMNIILGDCEEFRKIRPKKKSMKLIDKRRTLGLVLIRGENVASIVVEAPPPKHSSSSSSDDSMDRPSSSGHRASFSHSRHHSSD